MSWDLRLWFHDWTWAILQQTWCLILYLKQKKIGHLCHVFNNIWSGKSAIHIKIFQWNLSCAALGSIKLVVSEKCFYLSPIRSYVKTISSNGGHLVFFIQTHTKKTPIFCIGTFNANTCIVRILRRNFFNIFLESYICRVRLSYRLQHKAPQFFCWKMSIIIF